MENVQTGLNCSDPARSHVNAAYRVLLQKKTLKPNGDNIHYCSGLPKHIRGLFNTLRYWVTLAVGLP